MNQQTVEHAISIYVANEKDELEEILDRLYQPPIDFLRNRNEKLDLSVRASDLIEHHGDWPDVVKDMLAVSRQYPDYVFRLFQSTSLGMEMAITYFKAGHLQVAGTVITFEPYDSSRLEYVEDVESLEVSDEPVGG
jgi:hypothetical protein